MQEPQVKSSSIHKQHTLTNHTLNSSNKLVHKGITERHSKCKSNQRMVKETPIWVALVSDLKKRSKCTRIAGDRKSADAKSN